MTRRSMNCDIEEGDIKEVDIKERAEENLSFIRGAMERAERVSSASGAGGMVMGVVALIAMAIASRAGDLASQLTIWIASAFAATIAGALSSWLKARAKDLTLIGDPGRRFLLCLLPPILVGIVLTALLWQTPQITLIPGLWMMLYGCGLLAAGTYAARPIMLMGGCFIVAGLFTHTLPDEHGNLLLGIAFGGFHLIFGYQVFRHHGG